MRAVNFLSPIRRQARLNKGLLRWWRAEPFRTHSPRIQELNRKSPAAITGGLRLGPRGLVGAAGVGVFDGVNDYGQSAAIDLTGTSTLCVSFWMYWNSYVNNDDLCLESSADYNSNTGGIAFNPNSSSGTNFFIGIKTSGGYNVSQFTRPSAAVWHHYVTNFDRNAGAQQVTHVYVDGVAQSLSNTFTDANSGNFGNFAWNFMGRNGASAFGAGRIDDIRIYNRVLPAWEARALMHASRRGYPQELRWSRGDDFIGQAASVPPAPAPIQMSLCDWDWGKTMAVDTYHNLEWGTLDAISDTPLQVDASTTLLFKGAVFRADPGNAQTLYLGGATVTPGTTPATDGISLSAGESITLPIDQLSRIYVVAPSGSNKLQFLGI